MVFTLLEISAVLSGYVVHQPAYRKLIVLCVKRTLGKLMLNCV